MKTYLAPVLGSLLVLAQPALAAPPAAATPADQAAKLAEAHAIIAVMFPAATRAEMVDNIMTNMMAPIKKAMPLGDLKDPGLQKIVKDYMDEMLATERPLMLKHIPAMLDAMAVAYTHQFSLAELKDIHAFAESPSGNDYFRHATTILGDPAVQKVNTDIATDAQGLAKASASGLKDKVIAYLEAHPEVAKKLAAEESGK